MDKNKKKYLYCSNCRCLTDCQICPECGNENLTEPNETDDIFLAECDPMNSDALSALLKGRNIPFKAEDAGSSEAEDQGSAVRLCLKKFYVPLKSYDDAKNVLFFLTGKN